jgi:hypothetical protein
VLGAFCFVFFSLNDFLRLLWIPHPGCLLFVSVCIPPQHFSFVLSLLLGLECAAPSLSLFFFCFFLVRPLDFLALFFVPRATRRSSRVSAASIFRSSLARAPSPISVSPARGSGLVTGFGGEGHPTLNFVLLPSDGSGRCCSGKGFVFFFLYVKFSRPDLTQRAVRFFVLQFASRF